MKHDKIAVQRVTLALEGFTGVFDNASTGIRETWLQGTIVAEIHGYVEVKYSVPMELADTTVIEWLNYRRREHSINALAPSIKLI